MPAVVGIYTEATDPDCLDEGTAVNLLAGAPRRGFGIIGGSTAKGIGEHYEGYRTLDWPDRIVESLTKAVGPIEYLNLAQIGVVTNKVIERQLDAMKEFAPDLSFFSCGGNDLFVETPDYGAIECNLTKIFSFGSATGARLATMTLADAISDPAMMIFRERLERLNNIVRARAAKYDVILVDLWNHSIGQRPNILSSDKIHFTMAGNAVLGAEVIKALAAAK
ncbi:SGNH/GDSL hydrolase family protein [Nocardia sp. BSTN01]|uniref:SGNH/GDSL hydrolase family protein n=1 Tax=Nocardia sp. BSTN01 TaxID=2783665 RepID=UPI001890872C|nr:SGNH/GDSL hydrolase family protein [Nocardia sp. BSTN01]MBF4999717.1 SGNH/GDSL hydrolase family protein [Nocardia sp. BSTN01]